MQGEWDLENPQWEIKRPCYYKFMGKTQQLSRIYIKISVLNVIKLKSSRKITFQRKIKLTNSIFFVFYFALYLEDCSSRVYLTLLPL